MHFFPRPKALIPKPFFSSLIKEQLDELPSALIIKRGRGAREGGKSKSFESKKKLWQRWPAIRRARLDQDWIYCWLLYRTERFRSIFSPHSGQFSLLVLQRRS